MYSYEKNIAGRWWYVFVSSDILCAGVMCSAKLLAENTVRVEWLHTQWHVVLCWSSYRVGQCVIVIDTCFNQGLILCVFWQICALNSEKKGLQIWNSVLWSPLFLKRNCSVLLPVICHAVVLAHPIRNFACSAQHYNIKSQRAFIKAFIKVMNNVWWHVFVLAAYVSFVVKNLSYVVSISMSLLQSHWYNGRMDIPETDATVPVTIRPTVPISCPPCSLTLRLVNPVGLTVSTCSVTFTVRDSPMTARTINIRAVPTLGSNSRVAQLKFHPVDTFVSGSGWEDYTMSSVNVSSTTVVWHCELWRINQSVICIVA